MIGLFVATFVLSNSRPRTAAVLAVASVVAVLIFRVIPGTASFIHLIIMALLIITAALLFMVVEWTEHKRTWKTYVRSVKATFSRRKRKIGSL